MRREESRSPSPAHVAGSGPYIGRSAPSFYLDLSRLLSRIRHSAPTGVDRVEMAYARGLKARLGPALGYSARHLSGRIGVIAKDDAEAFIAETQAIWNTGRNPGRARSWRRLAAIVPKAAANSHDTVLIQASPSNLHRPQRVTRMRADLNARLVALVHDLIPVTHPEYARPGGAAQHAARIETLRMHAASVLTNSAATAAALTAHWADRDHPPIRSSLLGTDPVADVEPLTASRPYFLCVGTIEPRKNHLLLLNVWRQMAETMPADDVPELVIAGRRGWENEMVVDMLERAPAMRRYVREAGRLGELDLAALLRGAHALLMPSFAEGFGLPVAEALSVGTHVIASDLLAHREAGGMAADFLSPIDGPAWMNAILDHGTNGPLRRAQQLRHQSWQAPAWDHHLAHVIAAAEAVIA